MKFLVVLPLLVAASIALPHLPYMPNGWATADTYDEFLEQVKEANAASGFRTTDGSRIAGGTEAKKGEIPEFCWLNIGFYQKSQVCGCWIYDSQWIVTSARCVKDCSEGQASNITVNFPQLSGKDAVMTVDKIIIPDTNNNDMSIAEYKDDEKDNDHRVIASGNMALLHLPAVIAGTKWAEQKDVKKAKIDVASKDLMTFGMAHLSTQGWKFRACGVGVIGNKGERAKGVVCADVNVLTDNANCKDTKDGMAIATINADQFCVTWPDRDHNICVGDFGGPVYAYKPDAKDPTKPDVANQEIICTLVASPNVRKNAQCLDGHVTMCQMFIGPIAPQSPSSGPAWVNSVITKFNTGK